MTTDSNRTRSAAGFWWSLTAAFLSAIVLSCVLTAWAVNDALSSTSSLSSIQRRLVLRLANLLPRLHQAYIETRTQLPQGMLLERRVVEKPYWRRHFPEAADEGYLLLTGVDPNGQSMVRLLRIADGATLAQWHPDWRAISESIGSRSRVMRAIHPLLLDDGDIVFNVGVALVRQSPCSPEPVWVLNDTMHHSIEHDGAGNLWVPSVAHEEFTSNPWLRQRVRDDALARVSLDGKVLEKRSFARILRENHLEAMLLGASAPLTADPIHLNQITAAPGDGPYWQRGDLLISSRHMSTVFLYRPDTGKIIWHQQGPWLNQHSVQFVDDHRISIFDNHVIDGAPRDLVFPRPDDINHVLIYDFQTRSLQEPFAALLAQARPVTFTEGRARILPDGGLFLEESNFGRHLRFTQTELLWSRVNDYDGEHIGIVNWSRYLTAQEATTPLAALARRCVPPVTVASMSQSTAN